MVYLQIADEYMPFWTPLYMNFLYSYLERWGEYPSINVINDILRKQFNAKLVNQLASNWFNDIEFETEEDKLEFILIWS